MSYVVRHRMEWDEEAVGRAEMVEAIAGRMGTATATAEDVISGTLRRDWYNREEDLRTISAQHPGFVIMVDCTGEDHEKWVEHYRDAKAHAQGYETPKFDECKLW